MTSWFSQESFLVRAFNHFADMAFLNVLIVVTSLPIVTVGASLSAGYSTARKEAEGYGKMARNYFRAFKQNFMKATVLWLVYLAAGAVVIFAWFSINSTAFRIPLVLLAVVWAISFVWVWPLQARFENKISATIWNSVYLGISKIGSTVGVAAVVFGFFAIFALALTYAPQALFLLMVMGFGLMIFMTVGIFERAFTPLVRGTATE
ncbi:MAG: YesL family protein [Bifidobacteriaceae bacterium]|jgi:uncharacterized membrane protein YesL|nr:YesL family protein [Bifidobacteriaceae bacterium]